MKRAGKRVLLRSTIGIANEPTRHDWVRRRLAALPKGSRLLDAGAGECQYKTYCGHLDYLAQDFCQYDGKGDASDRQTGSWDTSRIDIVSDICAIPEANASFDAILCTEVLEHIPDPQGALKEFARLLKPGGTLILTAPFCSMTHFSPYHFVSGFNRFYYEKHLPDLGFAIVEMTENGNSFQFAGQEIRRIGADAATYSGLRMGLKERLAAEIVLRFLQKADARDCGSKRLLNFGFHVLAKKQD